MFKMKSCLYMLELLVGQMASALATFLLLVAHGSAEAGSRLLSALIDLVNIMLRCEVPQIAVPILYGANECAIRKKDGGIRPIDVGFFPFGKNLAESGWLVDLKRSAQAALWPQTHSVYAEQAQLVQVTWVWLGSLTLLR